MAINYEFYESPNPRKDGKRTFHARVVGFNKVSTDQLAQEIQEESSLTKADVMAVLVALADKLARHLGEGNKVFLEDIGYFQVNLKCGREVADEEGMKRAGVAFKSVSFRADTELKKKMRVTKMQRSRISRHSLPLTMEQIDERLTEYFASHEILTRHGFQFLCQQTQSTAGRIIRQLVEAGKLKNISLQRNPVYVPVEGYYGR